MLKKKTKNLEEYYYQWMYKHKDDAARRLGLLRRYEWAGKDNRCPECGGMKPDVKFERKQFTPGLRGHADGCELDAECNG